MLILAGLTGALVFGLIPIASIGGGFHAEVRFVVSMLVLAMQVVLLFFSVYQMGISVAGLLPRAKDAKAKIMTNLPSETGQSPSASARLSAESAKLSADTPAADLPRILCLTAAHNEEQVIADHVRNLLNMDYPRNRYDVVILADNCSDATAETARSLGATVWERFNLAEKGKGYALQWALHTKANLDKYDAVCIFDADNLADLNFLRVMARHVRSGHGAIQGYLDTKNPWDNWITSAYASSYWFMNRFWQRARTRLTLSGALGGTGFCLSTQTLKKIPWEVLSLTEDLEYTVRLILRDTRVYWTDETRVYDEKPVDLGATMPQRKRWMQGHWSTAFRYSMPLAKKILSQRPGMQTIRALDNLMYLWQPVLILLTGLNLLVSLSQVIYGSTWFTPYLAHWIPERLWLDLVIVGLMYPMIAFALEDAQWKSFLYFPSFLLFNLTWIPVTIEGLLDHRKTVWSHTQHSRAIGFTQVGIKKGVGHE